MATQNKTLLSVSNLEVVYNKAAMAIQGVSLSVPERGIVAILGVNGAGKTTTMRAIAGFMGQDNADITDGTVEFMGQRINGKSPDKIARRGLILIPEREKAFASLSVEENLQASVGAKGEYRRQVMNRIFNYFPILAERKNQIVGYLSGGERQMLAIAQALLCSPRLLLVDELSMGLAPIIVTQLLDNLRFLRDDLGLAILLVEQNAAAALSIADYAYVMENGHVVFDGPPAKLTSHEDVGEFYLGLGDKGIKSYRDVKQYRRTRRWWT